MVYQFQHQLSADSAYAITVKSTYTQPSKHFLGEGRDLTLIRVHFSLKVPHVDVKTLQRAAT